ncbi:hypothetical protein [Shewanella sp. MBTL60-007]|uniref:hypothetical protein n=1 Tax=Shewanella sp. MBTL60-007 TaxID=2815911 RepID=UPI001BC488B7|nr:hypothetical protein [Shewanella sp. MBTL60-007]GIU22185.1 hypothetical protein TUM3792_23980 [Shewanella sp. MBTL60-007]
MGKVINGTGELYLNGEILGKVSNWNLQLKPSHLWNDDLSTCVKCGDKDWMADEFCSESRLKCSGVDVAAKRLELEVQSWEFSYREQCRLESIDARANLIAMKSRQVGMTRLQMMMTRKMMRDSGAPIECWAARTPLSSAIQKAFGPRAGSMPRDHVLQN